jgi:hypothetical protein
MKRKEELFLLCVASKGRQHSDFPGGHPPEYYPSLRLLNFAERTGYGGLSLRWPSTLSSVFIANLYMSPLRLFVIGITCSEHNGTEMTAAAGTRHIKITCKYQSSQYGQTSAALHTKLLLLVLHTNVRNSSAYFVNQHKPILAMPTEFPQCNVLYLFWLIESKSTVYFQYSILNTQTNPILADLSICCESN